MYIRRHPKAGDEGQPDSFGRPGGGLKDADLSPQALGVSFVDGKRFDRKFDLAKVHHLIEAARNSAASFFLPIISAIIK